jgi:hypothetical protein
MTTVNQTKSHAESLESNTDFDFVYNAPLMEEAYKNARDYCDTHGIQIYNATRGGKLEVFERVALEDVLAEPDKSVQKEV